MTGCISTTVTPLPGNTFTNTSQTIPSWGWTVCMTIAKLMPTENNGEAMPASGTNQVSILGSWPNPVTRGQVFTLRFMLHAGARAAITVTDITGHMIYASNGDHASGEVTEQIGTAGWPTGTYIVNVATGGHVDSRRIVVIDK
ncbi:MAG TPA: T9SS type A sorting domain-containing protein [Candidatus Kapabacteria bacterium]|nr:T9SS type A sorting domain-containing protein [Candidatus Kapabacteria bacterium]